MYALHTASLETDNASRLQYFISPSNSATLFYSFLFIWNIAIAETTPKPLEVTLKP